MWSELTAVTGQHTVGREWKRCKIVSGDMSECSTMLTSCKRVCENYFGGIRALCWNCRSPFGSTEGSMIGDLDKLDLLSGLHRNLEKCSGGKIWWK